MFETDLSISGIVERYEVENNKVTFIKWMGPTQVCYKNKIIENQGVARHPEGFSGPLGRFKSKSDKPSSHLSPGDLRDMGLIRGQKCKLELDTGFVIEGTLTDTLFEDRKLILLSWSDCKVTKGMKVYFQPDWGMFDQFIGEQVTNVYGGPADRNDFPEENEAEIETSPGRETPFSAEELTLFNEYEKLRKLRAAKKVPMKQWLTLVESIWNNYPTEWLLHLSLYEIGLLQDYKGEAGPWLEKILNRLGGLQKNDRYKLIERGLLNIRKEHTALVG